MKLTEKTCQSVLDKLYEKVETGEITPDKQNEVVMLVESENPEFTESIIDDQISRLDQMYKDGKITKEVYDKQKLSWASRRTNYSNSLDNEKRHAEEARLEEIEKENRKPINRLKRGFNRAFGNTDNDRRIPPSGVPVTESFIDFWMKGE